jgi:DNA polymerase
VFGEGNPDANILFLGEGPGYWEDQKARPFIGNAGALLNKLLQLIKLEREDVFITNVVNHRPPNNRDPLPEELEAYKPYVDKIVEIIDPKIVVTLGRFSMAKFIPGVKISAIHGKVFKVNWNGKTLAVVPMYHPAAALRRLEVKRQLEDDFSALPGIIAKLEELKIEETKEKVEQMSLV